MFPPHSNIGKIYYKKAAKFFFSIQNMGILKLMLMNISCKSFESAKNILSVLARRATKNYWVKRIKEGIK